ncbi:hypothetical protein E05_18020 [Plautia stali symbiont]|nr:hypothetical protein E05_18020 [Plautia stali symbiont]
MQKIALDKRTGGTVTGALHVTHSVNVGDVDSGLIANGDGSVAFYAQDLKTGEWNKDRLHWVQNLEVGGKLTANGGATFGGNVTVSWGGRTTTFHENGDVVGPLWGGALSGWLNNTFVRDIRLGHIQEVQIWKGPGYRDEPSHVITGVYNGNGDAYVDFVQRRVLQKDINGNWINVWFM